MDAIETVRRRVAEAFLRHRMRPENGRVLVTGNIAHSTWIPGLTVEDWRLA